MFWLLPSCNNFFFLVFARKKTFQMSLPWYLIAEHFCFEHIITLLKNVLSPSRREFMKWLCENDVTMLFMDCTRCATEAVFMRIEHQWIIWFAQNIWIIISFCFHDIQHSVIYTKCAHIVASMCIEPQLIIQLHKIHDLHPNPRHYPNDKNILPGLMFIVFIILNTEEAENIKLFK